MLIGADQAWFSGANARRAADTIVMRITTAFWPCPRPVMAIRLWSRAARPRLVHTLTPVVAVVWWKFYARIVGGGPLTRGTPARGGGQAGRRPGVLRIG